MRDNRDNAPTHDHGIASDTSCHAIVSTTTPPEKKYLPRCPEQHIHRFRAVRPHSAVRQTESAEGSRPLWGCWVLSVPYAEAVPLPQQKHSQLKRDNGRTPRIRYAGSCNRPSPRIFPVSVDQTSGNPDSLPRACIYSPRARYPETLLVLCIPNHCYSPAHF